MLQASKLFTDRAVAVPQIATRKLDWLPTAGYPQLWC
jgi:hypothetical protein